MPVATWKELGGIYAGIADGSIKLIGWGSGATFQGCYREAPIRLSHLIDWNPNIWGQRVNGFEVLPPDSLKNENPAKTVILLYPFRFYIHKVLEMLQSIGPFRVIFPFAPSLAHEFASNLWRIEQSSTTKKAPPRSHRAILIAGLCHEGVTEYVAKGFARDYPEDHIVLSTWDHTPEDLLGKLRPFCDEIILTAPPANPGAANRNMQITAVTAGLRRINDQGLTHVLKARTDVLLTAEDILQRCEAAQELYSNTACKQHGYQNRIIVTSRYTLKYLPYFASDITMFGTVADMLKYWDVPLDSRSFYPYDDVHMKQTVRTLVEENGTLEAYLTRGYLQKGNVPTPLALADAWDTLRDFFIVQDENWFGQFFPRYDLAPLLNDGKQLCCTMSHAFWERLYHGLCVDRADLDFDLMTYGDHWRNAPLENFYASTNARTTQQKAG